MSTLPVKEQPLRGCGGDGRTASHCGGEDGARGIHMVMLGDVLRLGRGPARSGCRVSGGPGGPDAVDLMGGGPWCGAQCQWLCAWWGGLRFPHCRGGLRVLTAPVLLGAAPEVHLPLRTSHRPPRLPHFHTSCLL